MANITITISRAGVPVLVTGDAEVVASVLAALDRVLRGSDRRVLRIARDSDESAATPDGAA